MWKVKIWWTNCLGLFESNPQFRSHEEAPDLILFSFWPKKQPTVPGSLGKQPVDRQTTSSLSLGRIDRFFLHLGASQGIGIFQSPLETSRQALFSVHLYLFILFLVLLHASTVVNPCCSWHCSSLANRKRSQWPVIEMIENITTQII